MYREEDWRSSESARLPPMCPGFDSRPGVGVVSGLSLLVLYSAPRGFSPGNPVFPSLQKPTFDLICSIVKISKCKAYYKTDQEYSYYCKAHLIIFTC